MRVAVITGASAGVGKAASRMLAAQGWRVIGVGRDPARAATAEAEIRAVSKAPFDMIRADLSLMSETAKAASEVSALTDRVDLLLNNAGGVRDSLYVTAEGHEATFAANHLGPFLLTGLLLPHLRAAAKRRTEHAVRVVGVSSTGHLHAPPIDWNDLQMLRRKDFSAGAAYCQAKLFNILFARELGRRVAADGIVSQAMHPGVVDSNFIAHADASMQTYMKTLDLRPPEEAADTLVWLGTSPEAGPPSGRYFHQRRELAPSQAALDDAAAARLWQESERLVAQTGMTQANGRRAARTQEA